MSIPFTQYKTLDDLSFKEAIAVVQGNIADNHWSYFCKNKKLTKYILQKHASKLNWKLISKFQKLSEDSIEEFKDLVYWPYIFQYQNISEQFKKKFNHLLDKQLLEKEDVINTEKELNNLPEENPQPQSKLKEIKNWLDKIEEVSQKVESQKEEFEIITDFSDIPAKVLNIETVKIIKTKPAQYKGLTNETLSLEILYYLRNSEHSLNRVSTIATYFEVAEKRIIHLSKKNSEIVMFKDKKKNVCLSLKNKKPEVINQSGHVDLIKELQSAFNVFDNCVKKNTNAILKKSGTSFKDISMHKEKLRHVLESFAKKIK